MMEWIAANWKEILGTGGFGIIIVALINSKGKRKPSISQKSKSGKNSTTYQAGGNISAKDDERESVGE